MVPRQSRQRDRGEGNAKQPQRKLHKSVGVIEQADFPDAQQRRNNSAQQYVNLRDR